MSDYIPIFPPHIQVFGLLDFFCWALFFPPPTPSLPTTCGREIKRKLTFNIIRKNASKIKIIIIKKRELKGKLKKRMMKKIISEWQKAGDVGKKNN